MRKPKKNTLLIIVLLLMTCSTYAQAKKAATVSGIIDAKQPTTIYLSKDIYVANKTKTIADSTMVTNGRFSFAMPNKTSMYTLFIKGSKKFLAFIYDGNSVVITGDTATIYKATVTGSKENDIWLTFKGAINNDNKAAEEIFYKTMELNKAGKTDSVKLFAKKLDSANAVIHSKVKALFDKYPQSVATLLYLGSMDKKVVSDSVP